MTDTQNGSWDENRKLILHELREISTELAVVRDTQTLIREDLAGLKVKAGILGGMAGAVSSFLGHLLNRTP